MSFLQDFKTIEALVMHLLTDIPATRDSDKLLTYHVWKKQIGERIHLMSGDEALKMLVDKKLCAPESIRRRRQELQQKFPWARGETYNHRHQISEPEAREELSNNQSN